MGSLNKAMLVGRLGKDPEVRFTPSGQNVASISVATDFKWTDKTGEKKEKTEWHRVKAWGKLGDLVAQYLSKGSQVYVEGRLETSEYTDKMGVKKSSTEIVADEIVFLGSKADAIARASAAGGLPRAPAADSHQEEIPF